MDAVKGDRVDVLVEEKRYVDHQKEYGHTLRQSVSTARTYRLDLPLHEYHTAGSLPYSQREARSTPRYRKCSK
jgi:hypothetical protein